MATNYTKTARVAHPRGVWNASGSTIPANVCLVLDSTPEVSDMPSVAVPGTASTPTNFMGVTTSAIPNGRVGNVISDEGDEVAILADVAGGSISAGARLTISTTVLKEGYVKADTSASVLKVGYALEGATADGQLIRVKLSPKMAEA